MIRSLVFLLSAASFAAAADTKAEKMRVYFGTYSGGKSKGIYRADLDTKTGALTNVELAAETGNPSFVAIHPSGKFLYAVGEASGLGGTVTAFAIDANSGDLKSLNQQSSKGGGPCHIVVDKEGKNALIANYGGGSVAAFPIGEDGKLADATAFVQHRGKSVNPARQQAPHAHSINLDGVRFVECCFRRRAAIAGVAFLAGAGNGGDDAGFQVELANAVVAGLGNVESALAIEFAVERLIEMCGGGLAAVTGISRLTVASDDIQGWQCRKQEGDYYRHGG